MFNYLAEQQAALNKSRWQAQHRWRAPSPEIWVTLAGEITESRIDHLIAEIDDSSPLIMTIDSDGGSVEHATRLYDQLRQRGAPSTAIAGAYCNSAALICFLGADTRIAKQSTTFLLHCVVDRQRVQHLRPTANVFRDEAATLDECDRDIMQLISARCRYSMYDIRKDMAAERTLDGHEAWLKGIVTNLNG